MSERLILERVVFPDTVKFSSTCNSLILPNPEMYALATLPLIVIVSVEASPNVTFPFVVSVPSTVALLAYTVPLDLTSVHLRVAEPNEPAPSVVGIIEVETP